MMTGRGTAEWALTGRMGIELSYARALAAHVPIEVGLTARFRELAAAEAALQAETILPAQAVPARRVRLVQHRSRGPGKAAEHRCHSADGWARYQPRSYDFFLNQLTDCRVLPV